MKKHFLISIIIIVAAALSFPAHSFAEPVCVHGTAGKFQTPDNEPSGAYRFGWGLDFRIEGGNNLNYDWVHYSIPVNSQKAYSNIIIGYRLDLFGVIRHVHVWDGAYQIQHFNDINRGGMSPGRWGYLTLKLKSPEYFPHGLGISILLGSSVPIWRDYTTRIIIDSVCVQ